MNDQSTARVRGRIAARDFRYRRIAPPSRYCLVRLRVHPSAPRVQEVELEKAAGERDEANLLFAGARVVPEIQIAPFAVEPSWTEMYRRRGGLAEGETVIVQLGDEALLRNVLRELTVAELFNWDTRLPSLL